jgi:hypothetical protein
MESLFERPLEVEHQRCNLNHNKTTTTATTAAAAATAAITTTTCAQAPTPLRPILLFSSACSPRPE